MYQSLIMLMLEIVKGITFFFFFFFLLTIFYFISIVGVLQIFDNVNFCLLLLPEDTDPAGMRCL